MTEKKSHRPFVKISDEDSDWLEDQPITVWKLWHHAARSDRWGDGKWYELDTTVEGSAFKRARLKLQEYGAFKFRPMRGDGTGDYRRIEGWEVKNLHGALTNYWGDTGLSTYQKFLNSDYWQNVREQVLERDNHTCQGCGVTTNLHVHHMTYDNHGSEHEHLDDLITLCEVCHRKVHGLED